VARRNGDSGYGDRSPVARADQDLFLRHAWRKAVGPALRQSGPARTNADFYPATATNFILGGGGFASRLTQELREGKGYTYGVRSNFQGNGTSGQFRVFSPFVRM
jgi:hypothetical protein